jgi:hypothetical protein
MKYDIKHALGPPEACRVVDSRPGSLRVEGSEREKQQGGISEWLSLL